MSTQNRAEKIAGLRELADWLEAHPEMPMPALYQFNAFPKHSNGDRMDDATAIAELYRLGGLLGAEPRQSGPHVEVLGPKLSGGMQYVAVVCNVQLDHFIGGTCPCCGRPTDITQGEGKVGAPHGDAGAPTAPPYAADDRPLPRLVHPAPITDPALRGDA